MDSISHVTQPQWFKKKKKELELTHVCCQVHKCDEYLSLCSVRIERAFWACCLIQPCIKTRGVKRMRSGELRTRENK